MKKHLSRWLCSIKGLKGSKNTDGLLVKSAFRLRPKGLQGKGTQWP
jgi:hypothetical protein